MASKNKVQLGGNLVKDPEPQKTNGDSSVTTFTLAVTRPGAKLAGQDNGTDYFPLVSYGPLAKLIAERKKKGHALYVEGSLEYSSWEAQDGKKRSRTRVKADDVQFVDTVGNGVNHVLLIGNLTRDPETRHVDTGDETGVPVCSFGLAMNRVRSRDKDVADFANVDVWREQGEAVQDHKTKGDGVMVEGRLRQEVWGEEGSRKSAIKVVGSSVQFTSAKKPANGQAADKTAPGTGGQTAGRKAYQSRKRSTATATA